MLSTATYILLNEIAGAGAKRPIGALMLVTGLSSSLFWPITAALTEPLRVANRAADLRVR